MNRQLFIQPKKAVIKKKTKKRKKRKPAKKITIDYFEMAVMEMRDHIQVMSVEFNRLAMEISSVMPNNKHTRNIVAEMQRLSYDCQNVVDDIR